MNILLWHVHGGWTDAFVRGSHNYYLPQLEHSGPWGLGRSTREWPENVHNVAPGQLAELDLDLVILQRTEELSLVEVLLGKKPGRDIPAIFVEHNTPRGDTPSTNHPLADQREIIIAHVTHFNSLFWDTGRARTTVIEHGVKDPGPLYSGEIAKLTAVINEPVRRARIVGTDLLPQFATAGDIDVFGIAGENLGQTLGVPGITHAGDLPTRVLHQELALRRVYIHPFRWTSLGLALIEAMLLGMPVVALATTEATRAVDNEAGAISTDVSELVTAARTLLTNPDEAARKGQVARQYALDRFSLDTFLLRWDELLTRQIELTVSKKRGEINEDSNDF